MNQSTLTILIHLLIKIHAFRFGNSHIDALQMAIKNHTRLGCNEKLWLDPFIDQIGCNAVFFQLANHTGLADI